MLSLSARYRVDIERYEAWLSERCMGSCPFTSDDVVSVGRVSADGQTAYSVWADGYFASVQWMPTCFLIKEMS